ncbi:hypothetical protein RintRC_7196 [Richelia intracellularis]|nr:hypothetical protein RintRC_7196 [Richelia intracellularis]
MPDCLTTTKLKDYSQSHTEEDTQQYLSPISRKAEAIRQWRKTLETKKS